MTGSCPSDQLGSALRRASTTDGRQKWWKFGDLRMCRRCFGDVPDHWNHLVERGLMWIGHRCARSSDFEWWAWRSWRLGLCQVKFMGCFRQVNPVGQWESSLHEIMGISWFRIRCDVLTTAYNRFNRCGEDQNLVYCYNTPPLTLEYFGGVRQEISEKYFTWLREIYPPHVFFGLR
jgi:hypothetical protein